MGVDALAPAERLARLERALDELREDAGDDVPILVEGDKDIAALENLSVNAPLWKINTGLPLFEFVETFAREHREAILLVDWDRTGGRLARRLREACAANTVRLNDEHRRRIAYAVGGDIKTVEALDTYYRTLQERTRTGQSSSSTGV